MKHFDPERMHESTNQDDPEIQQEFYEELIDCINKYKSEHDLRTGPMMNALVTVLSQVHIAAATENGEIDKVMLEHNVKQFHNHLDDTVEKLVKNSDEGCSCVNCE